MFYSQRQIQRANEIDLASFLINRGEKLKRSGKDMEWVRHDLLMSFGLRL